MDRSGESEAHDPVPEEQRSTAQTRLRQFEIDGVALNGPSEGFGPFWRKRYRVRLDGPPVPPETVISTWRAHFGDFWPEGNRFSTPLTRITPGDLAHIEIDVGGGATDVGGRGSGAGEQRPEPARMGGTDDGAGARLDPGNRGG